MGQTARDVMSTDVTTIREDQSVEELIHLFRVSHFTGVPVVDAAGKVVGVVSETDILRALAYTISPPTSGEYAIKEKGRKQGRDKNATSRLLRPKELRSARQINEITDTLIRRTVHDLMTPVVVSCSPDDTLADVCQTMAWKHVHRIVVVDEAGKPVGLISALDAVQQFADSLRGG